MASSLIAQRNWMFLLHPLIDILGWPLLQTRTSHLLQWKGSFLENWVLRNLARPQWKTRSIPESPMSLPNVICIQNLRKWVLCGTATWRLLSLIVFFSLCFISWSLPTLYFFYWLLHVTMSLPTYTHTYIHRRARRKETHPLRTTMKSMTFQPLRRYEPLWKMKPRATILIPASKQKIPMKYGSVFSCEDEEQRNDKRIVPYQI